MARERKYFYPQVVLTCQDKLINEILEQQQLKAGGLPNQKRNLDMDESFNQQKDEALKSSMVFGDQHENEALIQKLRAESDIFDK